MKRRSTADFPLKNSMHSRGPHFEFFWGGGMENPFLPAAETVCVCLMQSRRDFIPQVQPAERFIHPDGQNDPYSVL